MAANRTRIRGRQIACVPTDGGVNAGDPCLLGHLPGVSMNGQTYVGAVKSATVPQTIDTLGVYTLSVQGITTGGGNAAIASGDIVYYVPGNTPKLSANSTGTGAIEFGIVLGLPTVAGGDSGYGGGTAVASGATTSVDVRIGGVTG